MNTTWFAIRYDRGIRGRLLLNGDRLTDESGGVYRYLACDPKRGMVTVRNAAGETLTVPAVAFDIKFEWEED